MATGIIQKNTAGDSGWKSLAAYLNYRRIGDVLYIQGNASGQIQIPANGSINLGTLPVGYRPSTQVNFPVGNRGAATPSLYGVVATNGTITMINGAAVAVSYFVFNAAIPL